METLIHRIRDSLRSDILVLRWVFITIYAILLLLWLVMLAVFQPQDNGAMLLLVAAVWLASQGLFVFGAGTINLCFPIRRARLWMPVLVASFMLMVLCAAGFLAITELLEVHGTGWALPVFLIVVGGSWIGWGVLLWIYARRWTQFQTLWRLSVILFAGSLLELLASVPSHIITSKRPQCLAGLGTMLGIIAGIYVMFFAFGPMLVVLLLRPHHRRQRMESGPPACEACGYNLIGTLAAGRSECPECGKAITARARARFSGLT